MDFMDEQQTEALVMEVLEEILRHEDFSRLLDWMRKKTSITRQLSLEPGMREVAEATANSIALMIWNSTPLPGNGFKPAPIPIPGRNQPCFCGSGKKYKKCCGMAGGGLPPLDTQWIWPLLLEVMPAKQLQRAIREGSLPLAARIGYSLTLEETGHYEQIRELLEPWYLADSYPETGEEAGYGLSLLCDLYDQLGLWNRKIEVLQHVVEHAPASQLRSDALQRSATILADEGRVEEAFALLERARKDTPADPALGLLEVQLLLVKKDYDQAVSRSVFLRRKLLKSMSDAGEPEDDENPLLDFFDGVIADPQQARQALQPPGKDFDDRIIAWLEEQADRPLVSTKAVELEKPDQEAGPGADRPWFMLKSSPQNDKVVSGWYRINPVEPLFGTQLMPMEQADPWEPAGEMGWLEYILSHPEVLDSIEVVDSLLTIFQMHPAWYDPAMRDEMYYPLLERGVALVEAALAPLPEQACLPWVVSENRPALRILLRKVQYDFSLGDFSAAMLDMERVMTLNPDDNHGLRGELVNLYLMAEENEKALELTRRFADDILPEILYGRVLALYRLGRKEEALAAARRAKKRLPRVASYLCAARRAEPGMDTRFGSVSGGKQEAWEYRQAMRDFWKSTRGALTWLKKA